MAEWLPESWRQALARLREDVHRAVERWSARRNGNGEREPAAPLSLRESDFPGAPGLESSPFPDFWPPAAANRGPVVDVQERDDAVIVLAELPGLSKNDFKVEIAGDRLILRGEKKQEREEQGNGYRYVERSVGAFCRVIGLPSEVDPAKAVAKYKNGLLRITLPKTARANARRIEVRAA
jgi:HSP20 family protein